MGQTLRILADGFIRLNHHLDQDHGQDMADNIFDLHHYKDFSIHHNRNLFLFNLFCLFN